MIYGNHFSGHNVLLTKPKGSSLRARQAAARQANVYRATDIEAVEANKVVQQTTEVHAVEVNADQVIDEFCSHAYYIENILSDENSISYRFIVNDIEDIEVFKSKLRQIFLTTDVDILNQHF